MNVQLTQVSERIRDIIKSINDDGLIVDPREIAARAKSTIKVLGAPTVELLKFKKSSTMSTGDWQKFVDSIVFDLVVLRKIMVDFYKANRQRYLKSVADRNKALSDIAYFNNEIELLSKIASKELVDYITDSFVDTEFILEGKEAVDLRFGNVQLPVKRMFTKKVKLELPEDFTPTVDVDGPSIAQVLYSGSLVNTRFYNALIDSTELWIHRIKTKEYNQNVTIEFIVPLNNFVSSEVNIEPHSDTPMLIEVQISEDGNNYRSIDEVLTNGTELQFRYESKILSSIKIIASIASPSFVEHGISDYMFGFKNISILDVAYESSYEVTTVFRESSFGRPIKAVEIEADESLPDGTDITYEIRGTRYDLSLTDFMKIAPINRPDKSKPERIEIAGTSHYLANVKATLNERVEKYDEIEFYKIGEVSSEHNIDLNTIKLYRANGAWKLINTTYTLTNNIETRIDLRKDKDVPIHFYTTEDARFVAPQVVSVKHKVDFNEAGQELIPRSKDAIDPSTAIVSVKRHSFQSPIGFGKSGKGDKYYIDNGLSFPTLTPAVLSQVVIDPVAGTKSSIEPAVAKAPANIYGISANTTEQLIVKYADGSVGTLSLNVTSLIRIKTVTQPKPGSFLPSGSFSMTGTTNIAIVDNNGNESSFVGSPLVVGNVTAQNIIGISLNSYNTAQTPENAGATSRGYYLVPNQQHIDQAPNIFKNNEVYDLPVPFPVKITTDSFSGIFEVDRISELKMNDTTRPVLVITNPEKLGSFIPTAAIHKILTWEILSQDLTQEVIKLFDDKIYFNEQTVFEPEDKVEIKYRVSAESSTIRLLPETIEVIDSQSGAIFEEGRHYIYKDGIIHSTKESVAQDLVLRFTYEEKTNNLYELTTNLESINDREVSLKLSSFDKTSFKPDANAGEGIWFDDKPITISSVISVKSGLHTIRILAKDIVRLVAFSKALDSNDKPIFNINTTFSRMRGIIDPLTYVDYDTLKNSSYKGNPMNFSIINNVLVVPFNPNSNAFVDNRVYRIYKNEDLQNAIGDYYIEDFTAIPVVLERFIVDYHYTKSVNSNPEDALIKSMQVRIKLKRSINKNSGVTPLLKSLSLRIK